MRLKRVATLLFLTNLCIFGLTACAKKTLEEKIVNMNEQEQLEAVKKNGLHIEHIKIQVKIFS